LNPPLSNPRRYSTNQRFTLSALALALAGAFAAPAAMAADNEVVIGDIDDMSGVYADVIGQGGVEAARMAIADFGGTVLGKKIVLLTADHQNKPDLGASKFREWADQNGVNMILGGSNTGVSIAMSKVASQKKVPFIAIGAAGASLTNEDCTPYSVHYAYDTTSLANGTATAITKQGGKSWYFLTADYAFGTQLRTAAADVVEKNGGKSLGEVRVPLGTTDFSSFLLQAQGSKAQVLGLANAGQDFINSLKAAQEFGISKTMKPAALPGAEDRAGPVPHDRLVLGPQRRHPCLVEALLREDEEGSDHEPGRLLLGDPALPELGEGGQDHGPR
jgi:branched-chain amino acid transport system substrate-binding protein